MWKRLALDYWLLGLLVILIGAVFYMSRYAENCKTEHQENANGRSPTVMISPNRTGQGTQNANESHQCPNWIDTFAWPEGATTWALFLTLIVIAWQSSETKKAAKAAEKSVAQEKDFFIQSQRPKLIVSAFYLKSPSGEAPADLRRVDGSWYSGQFCITNTGSTEATVKKVLCVCPVLDSLPAKRPWEGQLGCEVNFFLHPGASTSYAFTIESQSTNEGDVGTILTQHRTLYAMGWIDYEDASGIRRTTRFCRRYDTKTGRFWPVENDPDYESRD